MSGAEPRLAGRRLALERERPVVDRSARSATSRDVSSSSSSVRITLLEDPRRQRMRREDHVRAVPADASASTATNAGSSPQRSTKRDLDPPGDGLVEERAVLRRSTAPSSAARAPARRDIAAACERRLDCLGDARLPVAHPREDRQAERRLERRAGLLGDRVQRRRPVALPDAERPVAGDEILEVLRRDRPAAADVGVVRRERRRAGRASRTPSGSPRRLTRDLRARCARGRARRGG